MITTVVSKDGWKILGEAHPKGGGVIGFQKVGQRTWCCSQGKSMSPSRSRNGMCAAAVSVVLHRDLAPPCRGKKVQEPHLPTTENSGAHRDVGNFQ